MKIAWCLRIERTGVGQRSGWCARLDINAGDKMSDELWCVMLKIRKNKRRAS